MRDSLVGTLLASQDDMDSCRRNCFELFGVDFILTEDYQPWLIEINSSPAMNGSTELTAEMCPRCFEDLIKGMLKKIKHFWNFFF